MSRWETYLDWALSIGLGVLIAALIHGWWTT